MTTPSAIRKKRIEVTLPLEAANVASAREHSICHGHPSTLHLWWAQRPLAATCAVLFTQMVDDLSVYTSLCQNNGDHPQAAGKPGSAGEGDKYRIGVEVPMASTFFLSKKKGREAYVKPVIEDGSYRFTVEAGASPQSACRGAFFGNSEN